MTAETNWVQAEALLSPDISTTQHRKMGFIVTRDERIELHSGPELEWTRELFYKHKTLVIKLSGQFLYSLLSKLRSSHNPDPGEIAINKLLDTYTRLYFSGAKLAKPGNA